MLWSTRRHITSGNVNSAFSLVTNRQSNGAVNYFFKVEDNCCDGVLTPRYSLVVNVTDNGVPALSTSCTYVIEVFVQKPPISLSSQFDFYINENSPQYTHTGQPLKNYVTDSTCSVTFRITDYKGDVANTFGIDANTGQMMLMKTWLNYEVTPNFLYQVTATDCHGRTASTLVLIHVLNVNDPPIFDYCPDGLRYENDDQLKPVIDYTGPVLYEASDEDSAVLTFSVVSVNGNADLKSMFNVLVQSPDTFELTSTWNLNYEWIRQYDILMSVTDGSSVIYKVCTVNVGNINEPPVMPTSLDCYVSSNASSGTELCDINALENDLPDDPNGWGTKTYSVTSPVSGVKIVTTGGVARLVLTSSVSGNGWIPGQIIPGLVVRDTDGGGLYSETSVTIHVREALKPPLM